MNHRITNTTSSSTSIQQLPPKRDLINFNRCVTIAVSYLSFNASVILTRTVRQAGIIEESRFSATQTANA